MVLTAPTPRWDTGVTPASDRTHHLTLGQRRSSCLTPNEHLGGSPADQAELLEQLVARRATAALHQSHPDVTFSLLPWVLDRLPGGWDVFHAGFSVMATRYEDLGLRHLLPIDRVWVGTRSSRTGAFGGFHHPDQGYRHLQMGAVVTRYGDLSRSAPESSALAALDLLRAYAHDCLHYGSYREYQMHGGELVRTRYGINRRDAVGRTYSAPDPHGASTTRNLGIIMEGATDREASSIARLAAEQVGMVEPDGMDRFAFRDVTGRLAANDLACLPAEREDADWRVTAEGFLAAMGSYYRGVNGRYQTFLAEIGGQEADELHTLIAAAMISGSVASLSAWLDVRRGVGAFATLFRASSYAGPDPSV